jgi:hypothetical protein
MTEIPGFPSLDFTQNILSLDSSEHACKISELLLKFEVSEDDLKSTNHTKNRSVKLLYDIQKNTKV